MGFVGTLSTKTHPEVRHTVFVAMFRVPAQYLDIVMREEAVVERRLVAPARFGTALRLVAVVRDRAVHDVGMGL